MAISAFYSRCDRDLASRLPVFGRRRARAAISRLAERADELSALERLIAARQHHDTLIRYLAERTLRSLEGRACDALCAEWAVNRDPQLGEIVAECGYVARKPLEVRLLSALRAGKPWEVETSDEAKGLLQIRSDGDAALAEGAGQWLRCLKLPSPAVDTLCAEWVQGRDFELGRIIMEGGYVASAPVEVRLLSALQAGRRPVVDCPDEVASLVPYLEDTDPRLREGVEAILSGLRGAAVIDATCLASFHDPGGKLSRICLEQAYRPSDASDAALFLMVHGQVDTYFQEHDGLGDLRIGYRRAPAAVRSRILEVARGGDLRLVDFVLKPRLSLRECSPEEISAAVESSIHRRDWARLLADCQVLPLIHSWKGWQVLAGSGWLPADAADAALVKQAAEILSGKRDEVQEATRPPHGSRGSFEHWLAEGGAPDLANLSESELLARLEVASPPGAVPLVAALATRENGSPVARRAVSSSPFWQVRLAGLITGLSIDAPGEKDPALDEHFWVREVARTVWSHWPVEPSPAQLDQLERAPREAFLGLVGRARHLLRALLAHTLTSLTAERDWVAPDEDAIEVTGFESLPLS